MTVLLTQHAKAKLFDQVLTLLKDNMFPFISANQRLAVAQHFSLLALDAREVECQIQFGTEPDRELTRIVLEITPKLRQVPKGRQ